MDLVHQIQYFMDNIKDILTFFHQRNKSQEHIIFLHAKSIEVDFVKRCKHQRIKPQNHR